MKKNKSKKSGKKSKPASKRTSKASKRMTKARAVPAADKAKPFLSFSASTTNSAKYIRRKRGHI